MGKRCVKCGYERQPHDTGPDYECPKCGVIYAKAEAGAARVASGGSRTTRTSSSDNEPSSRKSSPAKLILGTVVVAVVVWFGYTGFGRYQANQVAKAAEKKKADLAQQAKARQDEVTAFLLTVIKSNLKDPDSAQVRNLQFYQNQIVFKDGQRVPLQYKICGELNAKNGLGGYVGYRRFVVTGVPETATGKFPPENLYSRMEDPSGDDNLFGTIWNGACSNSEKQSDN